MEEKITQQISRVLDLLNTLDPTTEAYLTALHAIRELNWLLTDSDRAILTPTPVVMAEPKVVIKPQTAEEAMTETIEEQVSSEPEPVAEPAKPAVVALTYDDVRTICTEAMSRGVSIKPIISKYVNSGDAPKLTNVNREDYAALVEEVRNAK